MPNTKKMFVGLDNAKNMKYILREKKFGNSTEELKRGPIDETETTCNSIYMSLSAFQNSCQITKTKQC